MHRPALKAIARVVIGAMLFNALSPLSVLANDKPVPSLAVQRQLQQLAALNQKVEMAKAERARSPAERLSRDFQDAQDLVRSLHADQRARSSLTKAGEREPMELRAIGPDMRIEVERSPVDKLSDQRRTESEARLREHLRTLTRARSDFRADFDAVRRELVAKNLPAEILARHDQAVREFEQRASEFDRAAEAYSSGPDEAKPTALADLNAFFKRYPASRAAAPLEAKKLPWRAPEATTRQPAETQTAWFQNLWGTPKIMLAQAGGSIGPINFNVPPEPGQAPTLADLGETPETQRSPAIAAKAVELGNNPLNIHNWVRNNVEWLPSWGAVQSAEDTLNKRRGNAHDIASLEIALLRAANIPARYQYGTIELDADKLQNWIGGTAKVESAQQLLSQGGIANRGVVAGGQIAKVRMEHVWVIAFVNWSPSRGAKQGAQTQHVNPNGALNTWIPLDPSYKQYSYTPALDLKGAVPLDANALRNAAEVGATVNAQEGWVQNLNGAAVENELRAYQGRLKAYIDSQKVSATTGDITAKKIIPQRSPTLLAGSLPYTLLQLGQQTAIVPTNLQHQFRIQLIRAQDLGLNDASPVLEFQEKTSQLANKRLTLTYVPSTPADAALISSYLPAPHADGSPIQPNEFPSTLPGYLIKLRAQLTVDGQIVAQSASALTMGTELVSRAGFTRLSGGDNWDIGQAETHAAGQSTALGLSLQGVTSAQLDRINTTLQDVRAKLQSGNLGELAGEKISGSILTAVVSSWFAAAESHGRRSQFQANVIETPGLSYGFFHAKLKPIYWLGIVRHATYSGFNIDVPHLRTLSVSKTGDFKDWASFNRLRGQYMSSLEHSVLERFFSDATKCNIPGLAGTPDLPSCLEGVSASKLLAKASQAGQKIFAITPEIYESNPNIVQDRLASHSSQTKTRIQSYLSEGFVVTIHEAPLTQGGWKGAGFSALDPLTGAGAYVVEGGANGGELEAPSNAVGAAGQLMLAGGAIAALALFLLASPALFVAGFLFMAAGILIFSAGVAIYNGSGDGASEEAILTCQYLLNSAVNLLFGAVGALSGSASYAIGSGVIGGLLNSLSAVGGTVGEICANK